MSVLEGQVKLIGILGYPLSHSLSPVMHNTAFKKLNLKYCYLPFEVEPKNLIAAVEGIKALGITGFNVTIPFKERILSLLDWISPEASMIRAVNTVVNKQGKLCGYNTDGSGFILSLKEELKIDLLGKNAVIVGAGGAGRAIAFSLAGQGANWIGIANRTLLKAQKLAGEVQSQAGCLTEASSLSFEEIKLMVEKADLLINTSSVGMSPQNDVPPPVPAELLQPPLIVCDLIYNPRMTGLLKSASQNGCQIFTGLGMLVHQGAAAFKIWTGVEPPVEVIRKVLEEKLNY